MLIDRDVVAISTWMDCVSALIHGAVQITEIGFEGRLYGDDQVVFARLTNRKKLAQLVVNRYRKTHLRLGARSRSHVRTFPRRNLLRRGDSGSHGSRAQTRPRHPPQAAHG